VPTRGVLKPNPLEHQLPQAWVQPGRISLSDYTVGLERIPGFTPRPRHLDRSPDHSSDLVVVGRIHHLDAGRRTGGLRGHPDPAQPLAVR
jgi:hypothetical protein